MGYEACLFQIIFNKQWTMSEIKEGLKRLGFTELGQKSIRTINFEYITTKGIIEAQILHEHGNVMEFYIRFCLANPPTIADEVIPILKRITEQYQATVLITSSLKKINWDNKSVKELEKKINNSCRGFTKVHGIKPKSVRCDDVWEYIEKSGTVRWVPLFPKEK